MQTARTAGDDARLGFAGSSEQRYAIDRKIASGGIATVYRGRGLGALGFERPVAIKVCHPHLVDGPGRRDAFLDEARVAARIRHPNVVATLDVVAAHDGSVMIVMEYVEGLTVAGLIRAAARADAPVPVGIAARIVGDALAGLHAAHELRADDGALVGVVHRDVSPQNILVGVDGYAKLADFGVFKGGERLAPTTEAGELKGKLGYVAPEVYRTGGDGATRAADIYATGVVLWELIAGRRLWADDSHAALMYRVLAGSVPSLGALRHDVPAELDGVLARALALDPSERYATAEEFAHALERFAADSPARLVARHVRSAVEVDPIAPQIPTQESLTPHASVTPIAVGVVVGESRARVNRWATRGAIAGAFAIAGASTMALVATARSARSVSTHVTNGSVPATSAAAAAPPLRELASATPVPVVSAAPHEPVAKPLAPIARPRRETPSPSLPRPSSSERPRGGRPLYDPEEL